ncbi:hypothetical protein GCM10009839_77730 [Catenulispora yoronensis]|uniref:Nudix hydrolase domain-containing protein n=1 Tax=Catenulispora yoronensis TaxID=450799 RepID=A0ABN2VA19_9ACTN
MSSTEPPRITWRAEPVPDGLRVTQAYVWAIDPEDGRVLIQDRGTQHARRYSLPGGRPEPEDGGDPVRTAAREALEESQIHIDVSRAVYLGYQLVEGDTRYDGPHAQLRYAAPISSYEPIGPDPDNGRIHRRYMVSLDRAPEILAWGEPGAAQAALAKQAGLDLGLRVDAPAPDGHRDEVKARYLVCHDYGMGALWWWVTARSAKEIMERIADVVVSFSPESARWADENGYEEIDIDAPDPNELSSMKATRDAQRQQQGFGAVVGRGTVYFRCVWGEYEKQAPWWDDENAAYFLLEIGEDGYRKRGIFEYVEGPSHRMGEDDWAFNPPYDLYEPEWARFEIDQQTFEAAWEAAIPFPVDDE